MSDEEQDNRNTIPKQLVGKTFRDHPERINRKGRPKSFDKLRELAVSLANEAAKATGPDGKAQIPIEINGHTATQIEMLLRTMIRENPTRFVEIAFGKVPDEVKVELGWKEEAKKQGYDPDKIKAELKAAARAALDAASGSGSGAGGAGGDRSGEGGESD